jgi:AraC family transcriptional regulator
MNALEAICRAIEFIEAHLQTPTAVADVAAAVGYSVFHFCRTFNQVTHHTPYDYLVRRRLAEAARVLVRGEQRIIDVALDYCFNSPETFARAFRRVYGVSPRQARKAGQVDAWRAMPCLTRAHLEHLHKGAYLKPVLVEREAVRLVGVMSLLSAKRGEHALWAWLEEELVTGEGLPAAGERWGVAYYAAGWERRGYSYMAGVEAPAERAAPPGLAMQVLPGGEWARFVHKGPTRELGLTLDYIFHTWLPRSGRALARPLVVEQFHQGLQQAEQPGGERAVLIPLAHT